MSEVAVMIDFHIIGLNIRRSEAIHAKAREFNAFYMGSLEKREYSFSESW